MLKHVLSIGWLFLFLALDARIKNVITDLGGVIIESGHLELADDSCPSKTSIKAIAWSDWMRGRISTIELIERTSLFFDRACVIKLVNEALAPDRPMIQETVDVLLKLKAQGYKLYLLSNLSAEAHEVLVRANPFFSIFDGMVFSFKEGFIKPELQLYQILLTCFGLDPNECLFIDDKPVNIQAARQLGIKGFVYRPGMLEHEIKHSLD